MGFVVNADDFVATMIVLADYKLDSTIKQVLNAHEQWAIQNECRFANDPYELMSCVSTLMWHASSDKRDFGFNKTKHFMRDWDSTSELSLAQIIPFCLDMHSVSLSDSETNWDSQIDEREQSAVYYREFKQALNDFITRNKSHSQELKDILEGFGFESDIVFKYTCYQDDYFQRHPDQIPEQVEMPYPGFHQETK